MTAITCLKHYNYKYYYYYYFSTTTIIIIIIIIIITSDTAKSRLQFCVILLKGAC